MVTLMRYPEVTAATGLSRKTIERRLNAGSFPQPVRLGARSVAFRSDEVAQWIDDRPRAGDGYTSH